MRTKYNLISKSLEIAKISIFCFILLTFLSIFLLRFFNPPFTSFMIWESKFFQKQIDYRWTPINYLGENIALSVVASEDSSFCDHIGIDLNEIYKVIRSGEKRGASTITQQLAKNLFLWPGRSWTRKFIELYFTFLLEISVPKRRILEIYLNTVETSFLTFGVSQASEKYYKKPSNELTKEQAIRIALTLPNPKMRRPKKLKSQFQRRILRLKKDMAILKKDDRSSCFL